MVSTTCQGGKPGPGFACPRCGRQHRTWTTYAECKWPSAIWVLGRGPWASVSDCHPGSTIMLHQTREQAEQAKAGIDNLACGGRCHRAHRIMSLADEGEA